MYWEMFMILILLAQFLMIPIDIAFFSARLTDFQFTLPWKFPRFLLDLICAADVAVTFFTGYYDSSKKTVILAPGTIALLVFKNNNQQYCIRIPEKRSILKKSTRKNSNFLKHLYCVQTIKLK